MRVQKLLEQYAPECIEQSISDGSHHVFWTDEDEEAWQMYLSIQKKYSPVAQW